MSAATTYCPECGTTVREHPLTHIATSHPDRYAPEGDR